MEDKELKSLIKTIIQEVANNKDDSTIEHYNEEERYQSADKPVGLTEGFIPDISEIQIKKDLLVPHPQEKEAYLEMKNHTPARIGVWHSGSRYMSSTSLRFQADHAAAQDAVFSYVTEDLVKANNLLFTETIVKDKDEYITRPDFGRKFSDDEKQKIKKYCGSPSVQIMIGDGLSSAAIEANLEDILPSIKQGLEMNNIKAENEIFVKHCRVPAMDVIGEITGADVVCLLVGERPGLVTAESMSAYIAYKPTVGMPEARRTVISNIHQGGTPPAEAGAHIADLIKKIIDYKASGLDLNKMQT